MRVRRRRQQEVNTFVRACVRARARVCVQTYNANTNEYAYRTRLDFRRGVSFRDRDDEHTKINR